MKMSIDLCKYMYQGALTAVAGASIVVMWDKEGLIIKEEEDEGDDEEVLGMDR